MSRLAHYRALGFDRTTHVAGRTYRIKCSQCAALVINDMACHEPGCPNAKHECKGCHEMIPLRQRYCSNECAGR